MEFLALVTWLVLAGTGAILAPFAFSLWAGWAQVGMAAVGLVGGGFAAAQLTDDRVTSGSVSQDLQSGVVGLQLPIYCALAFVTLLVAAQGVDAVI